jgi:hypothetical protein
MAREVLHRSLDARQVPSILAKPSNGVQEAVVIRAELEDELTDLRTMLQEAVAAMNAAIAAKTDQSHVAQSIHDLFKEFVLTGGVTERRADPEDGLEYFYTEFRAPTGWGHTNFKLFDISRNDANRTRLDETFIFQRVDVDSYRVLLQSSIGPYPDGEAIITFIQQPPAPVATALRINTGSTAPYTDTMGNVWQPDTGFTGGFGVQNSVAIGAPMATGTDNPQLFDFSRDGEFTYDIPVANGTYLVTFLFCEHFYNNVGERLMNIDLQGARSLTNYDILAHAAKNATATQSIAGVVVNDGHLRINVASPVGGGTLSGLLIEKTA